MAVAQVATGSQTAVIGTVHPLASPVGGKTYVLVVDTSNLAAGDVVEFVSLDKPLATSALSALDSATIVAGPAAGTAYMSIPLPSAHGCSFTLKQTAGTARVFDWSCRSLD